MDIALQPDEGGHLLLDMAMSQYALGKLELARQAGVPLGAPAMAPPHRRAALGARYLLSGT